MKKVFIVLVLSFALIGFAYATDDLEKLKTDYQNVVNSFTDNLNSQRLLVEGFKTTNSTYRALVAAQIKLQKQAKALDEKIKELETPPEHEEVPIEKPENAE